MTDRCGAQSDLYGDFGPRHRAKRRTREDMHRRHEARFGRQPGHPRKKYWDKNIEAKPADPNEKCVLGADCIHLKATGGKKFNHTIMQAKDCLRAAYNS